MSLAQDIKARSQKYVDEAGPPMDVLADIAAQLKMADTARQLRDNRKSLESDTFHIIVLGRFRNGKSTFLNGLLCELTHPVAELPATGPLPVFDLPTTARLTRIDYGERPAVTVVRRGGKTEQWSLSRFVTDGKIRRNPAENERVFGDILEFRLKFPSKTLKAGITLIDSPGTDDIAERTEIVNQAVESCDAAVVVFRTDVLGGEEERKFLQQIRRVGLTDFFLLVNRRDGRAVDNDLKHEAWYRLVQLPENGPEYSGQDFAAKKIYFVDAKQALEGRLRGDGRLLEESGMPLFEERLRDFLEKERRPVHVRRFVQAADAHAQTIHDAIVRFIPSIKMRQEEFRQNYEKIKPELERIRKKKERLPKLFETYRRECQNALMTSFRELITGICRDLPTELASPDRPLPSLDGGLVQRAIAPFRKQAIAEEVQKNAMSIIEERIAAWQNNPPDQPGAQQVLKDILDRLTEEIRSEIKEIKQGYDRIQFTLTGYKPEVGEAEAAAEGLVKRVLLGAAAFIAPDHALAAYTSGWSGLWKSLLVHGSVFVLVAYVFGGPVGWAAGAAVAASILRNIIWGVEALREEIITRTAKVIIEGDPKEGRPGLRDEPDRAQPVLEASVQKSFTELEGAFTRAVDAEMAKEEQILKEQLDLNARSIQEKNQLLAALEKHQQEVARCRKALSNALIAVAGGKV